MEEVSAGLRLTRDQLGPDPLRALAGWLEEARDAGLGGEPVGTLGTVDEAGAPDARIVVVRAFDARGLAFHSDARSPKGRHVAHDPRASLVLHWPELTRQVRIRGEMRIAPGAESDAAFGARARAAQIGFWAHAQSEPIGALSALEEQLDRTIARFDTEPVTRPPHWVVYRLAPRFVEFWQSGERHLHDRFAYSLSDDGSWVAVRLQP